MKASRVVQSVVTRLVASLIVGGLLLSVLLGYLELQRSRSVLQMDLSRQAVITAGNAQELLRDVLGQNAGHDVSNTLKVFAANRGVSAIQMRSPKLGEVRVGDWPGDPSTAALWALPEHGLSVGTEVRLDRMTIVSTPFWCGQDPVLLELLMDGPGAWQQAKTGVYRRVMIQWLLLATVTLLGLLLVRRWFTGPLSDVVEMVDTSAGARKFDEFSSGHTGEFGRLSAAIGAMLTRLDLTTQELQQRERAFEDLYRFAPTAMVSLDRDGKVIQANQLAADLLGIGEEQKVVGLPIVNFVLPEDREVLRQTVDRLRPNTVQRCELRLEVGPQQVDAIVECVGIDDPPGSMIGVRLSLMDVSRSKRLQRQLSDKSRLMNLLVDHMSDGLLLVDGHGKIAAVNQTLANLLRINPEKLIGEWYDVNQFWLDFGVADPQAMARRLREIDSQQDVPAQERFETTSGTFLFQAIPVHDETQELVGRLWVVQEITALVQNQQMIAQQQEQLEVLQTLGHKLGQARSLGQMLNLATESMHEVFGVEAVGVAIRRDHGNRRSQQVLHRGSGVCLLGPNQQLVDSIEKHLMAQVLSQPEVLHWDDLPMSLPWYKAFSLAGITCVAASPLRGNADTQGMIWIGRRCGERLERSHLFLLEAMAPVIAARIEFAQVCDRMNELNVTDPATDLPNADQFKQLLLRSQNRPGHPWSVVVANVDHFRKMNDELGHEAADMILRSVAVTIQGVLRRSCTVARLSGASFGILCPDTTAVQAMPLGERIRQAIAKTPVKMSADGATREVTASLGVAGSPDDGRSLQDVLDVAADRVEMAKRSGRNKVVGRDAPAQKKVS